MFKDTKSGSRFMPLAVILVGSMAVSNTFSQTPHAGQMENQPSVNAPAVAASGMSGGAPARQQSMAGARSSYRPNRFAGRAGTYYRLVWGVDSLAVRWTESGEVIKFTYQVLDPDKAKTLNDKKLEPSLIDQKAGVKLVVPALEKVGQLRQTSTPEAGKSYWMAFSNKGRHVKRGDRVSVVIGSFHADGLVVD